MWKLGERLNKTRECFRVIHCELGECLAIECDVGFLHCTNELGIRHAVQASGGIYAECPEIAELTFLGAAMAESVLASFPNGFVCDALFARTVKAITFCLRQDVSAALGF